MSDALGARSASARSLVEPRARRHDDRTPSTSSRSSPARGRRSRRAFTGRREPARPGASSSAAARSRKSRRGSPQPERRRRRLRPCALAGAGAQPRARSSSVRVLDRTEPDPRHLRAARAQPRGQAAGRARAARAPRHAPGAAAGPTSSASAAASADRGPGETQLETDRRLIGERVKQLRERLQAVASSSATQRRARARASRRAVGVAGRLHQRRQVDAVQRADRRRRLRRPTSCSRRSTRPRGASTWRRRRASCCPTRSASSATCRTSWSAAFKRHARGDRRGRAAAARGRRAIAGAATSRSRR